MNYQFKFVFDFLFFTAIMLMPLLVAYIVQKIKGDK